MKARRPVKANSRRKHLKIQHHKMNTRRQFYFNQQLSQESADSTKEH